MSVPAENDEQRMLQTITKLLDKAGKDPRLTPRILREKAEQRLELAKGSLKSKREKIKDIIYKWWIKQASMTEEKESQIMKLVSHTWHSTHNSSHCNFIVL
jgi:ElaB/YqjD/DUF883 family membrane-anchored ribosome-binding protein